MEEQCLHPVAPRPVKVMVSMAKEHQNLTPQLGQGVQKNGWDAFHIVLLLS